MYKRLIPRCSLLTLYLLSTDLSMEDTPARSLRSATPSPRKARLKSTPVSELSVPSTVKCKSITKKTDTPTGMLGSPISARKRKSNEDKEENDDETIDDTIDDTSKRSKVEHSDIEFNKEERKFVVIKVRKGDTISSPCWSSKLCQVVTLTKEGNDIMSKKKRTYLNSCVEVNFSDLILFILFVKPTDFNKYPGLQKIYQKECVAICKVCFKNNRIPLKKAVIPTYRWQPGNCVNHLVSQHEKVDVAEYWEKLNEKKNPVIVKKNAQKIAKSPEGNMKQGTITKFTSVEEVVKEFNELLYQFFNSANISINQTSNPTLNDLLKLLLDNAHVLKFRRQQICFSPWRYKKQECKAFNNFTTFLTTTISSAREHYKEITGKFSPFISVSHDGWDSKRRDMIGCSIHFIHPIYWKHISVPIGLKYLSSKKSAETVTQLNKILVR